MTSVTLIALSHVIQPHILGIRTWTWLGAGSSATPARISFQKLSKLWAPPWSTSVAYLWIMTKILKWPTRHRTVSFHSPSSPIHPLLIFSLYFGHPVSFSSLNVPCSFFFLAMRPLHMLLPLLGKLFCHLHFPVSSSLFCLFRVDSLTSMHKRLTLPSYLLSLLQGTWHTGDFTLLMELFNSLWLY